MLSSHQSKVIKDYKNYSTINLDTPVGDINQTDGIFANCQQSQVIENIA